MKPSIAIVGCGRVGTVLARFLSRAGYPMAGFAGSDISSAEKAAEAVGTDRFTQIPWDVTPLADIVFITTPDGVIEGVCEQIAGNRGFRDGAVVLHCSGSLPSTILSSAKTGNAFFGSMHPLQSIASSDLEHNPFSGIVMSIEGEPEGVKAAEDIAEDLGAESYRIDTEAKALYHASAVVASNYLVTLTGLAFQLIEAAGISQSDAMKALKPLIQGTLTNIERSGIQKALTGPIARGDVETVKNHLKEIEQKRPELLSLYKVLGFHTTDIAAAAGSISPETVSDLKQITA